MYKNLKQLFFMADKAKMSVITHFFKYKRKLLDTACKTLQQRKHSTEPTKTTPKILFFGTDHFSLPSLKALKSCSTIKTLGTVTSFKNPANCVRLYAEEHKLPLYRWPISAEISREYELGVVVSFGHLIPTQIIQAFPLGMINVHASLLPRWRGAAPIIYAIMHGDAETGVSIMKIEPKRFDIGDILAQRHVPIKNNCLMPQLHQELANQGAELLLDVVNNFTASSSNAIKQDERFVTHAPKVTPTMTDVNWSESSATQLYNRYRALYGFKNLQTRFQNKVVQLINIQTHKMDDEEATCDALYDHKTPGSFAYLREKKCLIVRCANDSFIEIHQLRIEGKKVMTALDFNNGFLKKLKNNEIYFVPNKNVACC